MGSLNKTIFFYFLLVIKIGCIVCPTDEEIKECKDELLAEFRNDQPLDDFLHAFLNIKFLTIYWNERTDDNENVYFGNDVLKSSAGAYLNELYIIAQEMGLPELLSPLTFCRTQHGSHEYDCLSALEAIGCESHFSGPDCFEKFFFFWSKPNELIDAMPGTKHLSNAQLLDAIYNGCDEFFMLSDNNLFEAFSRRPDIFDELSDENLLQDYYRRLYEKNHMLWKANSRRFDGSGSSTNDDFYGRSAFDEYIRVYLNLEDHDYGRDSELRQDFDNKSLIQARMLKYGISRVSYEEVCKEYQRRKSLLNTFDNLYAMHIYEKIKHTTWDTSNFMNREEFCVNYLTKLQGD